MKKLILFRICMLLLMFSLASTSFAQLWNPAHRIGTVSGKYHFSYNQTPDALVEIRAAGLLPASYYTFQWEQSTMPDAGFANISGATQTGYTIPGALTQTTYFRRKTTLTLNGTTNYSNIIKISVVSVGWEDINYVREHEVLTAGVTTWQAVDQLTIGQKLQSTTYLDGLGRAAQKVDKEVATPSNPNNLWGDVVQTFQYDAYGKQPVGYLPYSTTTQSGNFKTTPLTEQPQYYANVYNETSPVVTLTYDNSPLYLTKNVKEPGGAWATSAGKSISHELNDAADNVKMFRVDYIQGNPPIVSSTYGANKLFKITGTDEHGKKVVQYANSLGQLILKKVQLDDVPSVAHDGWICTYYVYDEFGQLRFEITPEAVKYLDNNSWTFAGTTGTDVLNGLCFQFDYDDKGRVIWKKNPGVQPLTMLYDVRDRLVFAQDGNQASLSTPQWTATLYDELDRPVLSTLYNTSKSVSTLKSDIANAPVVNTLSISGNNTGGASTIDVNASLSPLTSSDLTSTATATVLKYFFYEDYLFDGAKPFNTGFNNVSSYSPSDPDVQAIATSPRTINMVTGTKTRVLGTNTFLDATSYYDDRGGLIQTLADNIKSGTDISTLQYHFDGRIISTCTDHTAAGTGYTNFQVLTKPAFDKLGRTVSIDKKFGTNSFKTVVSYTYDDMGKVKTKRLDPSYTANGGTELESLNYTFNIRNQLTGINKEYALKSGSYSKWQHFFGMYLGYQNTDNVFNQAKLDGQITGVLWNTQGDDAQRKYDYTYDNAGRLSKADFTQQQQPGGGWLNSAMDFSVSGYTGKITYDLNGNLLSMLHKGVLPGTASPITLDDLRYSYTPNTNRLEGVSDLMTSTSVNGAFGDFKDGANGSAPDYVYDGNGNLVMDLNKNAKDLVGTNGVTYNFLDKPEQIKIVGKGVITIVYTGDGRKLRRTFTPDSGPAITTTYINQFVYQSTGTNPDALSFISFEEGRIRVITPTAQNNGFDMLTVDGNMDLPNGKKGVYDYFILDYQQNVRMVLSEETRIAANTATMESSRSSVEESIFGQTGSGNEVSATRQGTPGGWTGNTTASVSRLGNIAGHNIGPNTLQKVMAGDVINAQAQYYYDQAASGSNSNFVANLLSSLLPALSGGPTSSVVKGSASNITSQLNANGLFVNAVQPSTGTGTTPLAYITVLFFDERFNFISAADGGAYQQQVASSVGSAGAQLLLTGIKAPKNGYVYAYVSNQSDQHVYFDDFAVSIAQGNIIEESHYYSFGLKISAISSKKFADSYDGDIKNNYQMQGAFSEMDDDIGWNDFALRSYDAQIGRFVQQDPYQQYHSPYVGMGNDPVNVIDPSGGVGIPCPGTSALSIFLESALYSVGNALNSASTVMNVVGTAGTVTQTATVMVTAINASGVINGQLGTNGVGSSGGNDPAAGPDPALEPEEKKGGAWLIKNQWNEEYIAEFREWASQAYDAHYKYSGEEFTCEDYALKLLIHFASSKQLPLIIKNGSHPEGISAASDEFSSPDEYYQAVAKSTAAVDLLLNSKEINGHVFAKKGDIAIHFNDKGRAHHTQVVTGVTAAAMYVVQGNFHDEWWIRITNRAENPRDQWYIGTGLQKGYYSLSNGNYHNVTLDRVVNGLLFNEKKVRFFSWDFYGFNK